jgi:hypothetical protein
MARKSVTVFGQPAARAAGVGRFVPAEFGAIQESERF